MASPLYAADQTQTTDKTQTSSLTFQDKHDRIETPVSIFLYRPTYVLPYYFTASPDDNVYLAGDTPNHQKIMFNEFKAQLSLLIPVVTNMMGNPNSSIDIAYTQLNFWQVYAASQYFRETNYEPEIFWQKKYHTHWTTRVGFDHQSNGRGGTYERSWNRATAYVEYEKDNWLIGLTAWALILKPESSDLHNPDIAHYLGHENLLISYLLGKTNLSLQLQNIESGMHQGFVEISISHPISKTISLYAQYYNGYGQSLIEYNHRTQAAGLGISFSNWY